MLDVTHAIQCELLHTWGRVRRVIRLLDPVHLGTAILPRDRWKEFDRFLRVAGEPARPEMRRHVTEA